MKYVNLKFLLQDKDNLLHARGKEKIYFLGKNLTTKETPNNNV